MFKNLKLGVKLNGSFLIVSGLTLLLGMLAIMNMYKVKAVADKLDQQNVPAVGFANEVERDSLKTMYEVRGYAFTEEKGYLDRGRQSLAEVKKDVDAAAEHAAKYGLKVLAANAKIADEKAQLYGQLLDETVKVTAAMDKDGEVMNTSAAEYMKICYAFLDGQMKELDKDIEAVMGEQLSEEKLKERVRKTVLCNEVINLGNTVRINAWKSVANRDPDTFKETMKKFGEINAKLDELKKITRKEVNLRQIEDCRAAGEEYHKGMEGFLANWYAREELGKKRGAAGEEVLKAARETAEFNMKATEESAEDAAASLASASTILIVGCIVCVALAIGLGIMITRMITGPVGQ
jgi:methyl-accepting chemotaxis protein